MTDEPPMPERLRDAAEKVAALYAEDLGVALTYDQAGVEWIDGHIDRLRRDLSADRIPGVLTALGAFVGEAMVRSFGGAWAERDGDWGIQLPNGPWCNPIGKVHKQFQDGPGESVASFYKLAPKVASYIAQAKKPAGGAPPEGP